MCFQDAGLQHDSRKSLRALEQFLELWERRCHDLSSVTVLEPFHFHSANRSLYSQQELDKIVVPIAQRYQLSNSELNYQHESQIVGDKYIKQGYTLR